MLKAAVLVAVHQGMRGSTPTGLLLSRRRMKVVERAQHGESHDVTDVFHRCLPQMSHGWTEFVFSSWPTRMPCVTWMNV